MGISMFVGRKEFRLTSGVNFNSFLNEISELDDYPNFLLRSFSEGRFTLADSELSLFKSSIEDLLDECEDLETKDLSELSKYVLLQVKRALKTAIREKKDVLIF